MKRATKIKQMLACCALFSRTQVVAMVSVILKKSGHFIKLNALKLFTLNPDHYLIMFIFLI